MNGKILTKKIKWGRVYRYKFGNQSERECIIPLKRHERIENIIFYHKIADNSEHTMFEQSLEAHYVLVDNEY